MSIEDLFDFVALHTETTVFQGLCVCRQTPDLMATRNVSIAALRAAVTALRSARICPFVRFHNAVTGLMAELTISLFQRVSDGSGLNFVLNPALRIILRKTCAACEPFSVNGLRQVSPLPVWMMVPGLSTMAPCAVAT